MLFIQRSLDACNRAEGADADAGGSARDMRKALLRGVARPARGTSATALVATSANNVRCIFSQRLGTENASCKMQRQVGLERVTSGQKTKSTMLSTMLAKREHRSKVDAGRTYAARRGEGSSPRQLRAAL